MYLRVYSRSLILTLVGQLDLHLSQADAGFTSAQAQIRWVYAAAVDRIRAFWPTSIQDDSLRGKISMEPPPTDYLMMMMMMNQVFIVFNWQEQN